MTKQQYKKQKNRLNQNHPELQAGEVWLTNILPPTGHMESNLDRSPRRMSLSDIAWTTKRTGVIAYTTHNEIHRGYIPVFVKRSELIGAGIDLRTILPEPITNT